MAEKACLRSKAPPVFSGGNSTTRKMVPCFGGSSTTGRSAASALPVLRAGVESVTHRFVRAKSVRPPIVRTWGEGPAPEREGVGRGPVAQEGGAAPRVVPGDDTPNFPNHRSSPLYG